MKPRARYLACRGAGKRGWQRGFALAEILLAVALWMGGFLGVMALFTTCHAAVAHSSRVAYATTLAQSQLEALKFSAYNSIVSVPEKTATVKTAGSSSATTSFFYTITVSPNVGNTVKNISIDVTWQEPGYNGVNGTPYRSVRLETEVNV